MTTFLVYFALQTLLIVAQAVASYYEGYLSQSQLIKSRIHGYSFLSHGNIWADFIIISLLCSYILSAYHIPFLNKESGMTSCAVLVLAICFVIKEQNSTAEFPTAFALFGKITIAGWLHLIYFAVNLYVIIMFYVTQNNVSDFELCIIGISLCAYSFLSIVKFPLSIWKEDTFSGFLVIAEILLVGIATFIKILK